MAERGGKPEPVGDALASFLKAAGLERSVGRASVLVEWEALVGPQIASVTTPQRISQDGTLFIAVATHGWMSELQLMETQLLARINAREGREPVRRIRWELRR
jgi:predicted nucleic acid-binding Zn ribbon protein